MSDNQFRCPGCMKQKKNHPVCELCGWDERTQNEVYQLPVGSLLRGQYRIGRVLGQGGFGITYLGFDEYLDMPVAIKEYYPGGLVTRDVTISTMISSYDGIASDQYEENKNRFMREGKSLAKFSYLPNIVKIHNFFPDNNTVYMVMEYVEGITLQQKLKKSGPMTLPQALSILEPIMKDLDVVHRSGTIHRDISPDNIMLTPKGGAKLLDFGAMKAIENPDQSAMMTKSTLAILKQGFAPLEQYHARGSLGPWTDVYALCATLCDCISGKVPQFAPERASSDNPDAFIEELPGLTVAQREVFRRGMALRPRDRISSVSDLLRAFHQVLPGMASGTPDRAPQMPEFTEPAGSLPKSQIHAGNTAAQAPGENAAASHQVPKKEKEKKSTPWKWAILLAAAAAAAAIVIQIAKPEQAEPPVIDAPVIAETEVVASLPAVTAAPETEPAPTEYIPSPADLILKNFDPFGTSRYAFGSEIPKGSVGSVVFRSSLKTAPQDAQDVSESGSGQVLMWIEGDGYPKTLVIAGNGSVLAPVDCSFLFGGDRSDLSNKDNYYINLKDVQFNGSLDFSGVENTSHMFEGCEEIMKLSLAGLDFSQVRDMSSMFKSCRKLQKIDFSGINTENVTNMSRMFDTCWDMRALDVSNLDTSNVTDMNHMFTQCSGVSFDLSGFDTSNVRDFSGMFESCSGLMFLDLSGFDTSSGENMSAMFAECYHLEDLNISSFDTSNVTNMFAMFADCEVLETLDLSHFDTSNVENMTRMFILDRSLRTLDLSSFQIETVTEAYGMFESCRDDLDLIASEEIQDLYIQSIAGDRQY